MTDRFSGKAFTDPQSENIKVQAKGRKFGAKEKAVEKKPDKPESNVTDLYQKGIDHLKLFNFIVELSESGDHVKHSPTRGVSGWGVGGLWLQMAASCKRPRTGRLNQVDTQRGPSARRLRHSTSNIVFSGLATCCRPRLFGSARAFATRPSMARDSCAFC